MYNIGELIVYGRSGVCRVENIGYPEIPGIKKDKLYYTLVPLYNKGKIFIPVDTENFMRYQASRRLYYSGYYKRQRYG